MGMWMVQIDDPKEHVEDPMGLQRPADRDTDADADELADSVSELEEARLAAIPGAPTEVLASDDPPDRRAAEAPPARTGIGLEYPEWDHRVRAYHLRRALIRERPAVPGDPEWAVGVRRRYVREVAEVRRRFERLRGQRERLMRQLDGDDLDLGAFVTAWADARASGATDDRLYERVRPGRRDVAISLLVDVSGSTDSWIADQRRIIDVEKEALVLVCEALDALGDRYNLLAFSGEGPRGVDLHLLKGFSEPYGRAVRERIAGLEHDRYTRVGAAIRHATAGLCREHARHRLLLVLSDGKPNDVDEYEGRYGVEDARQAVVEARLQGLATFCLTVDREAPVYLPRIFGSAGYAVLRQPGRLPAVLVEVVRQLLQR
jgi:nitric oxide reductase NorD protein